MRITCFFCLSVLFLEPITAQKIAAHRGYSKEYPENSIESIIAALENDFDAIELDLQITKDNVIVLLHDDRLDRTSNYSGRIIDYTYEELKNVNFNYSEKFENEFQFISIATLKDALELIEYEDIELILDLKRFDIEKHISSILFSSTFPANKISFIVYDYYQALSVKETFSNSTVYHAVFDFKDVPINYFFLIKHLGISGLAINNKQEIESKYSDLINELGFTTIIWNIETPYNLNEGLTFDQISYFLLDQPTSWQPELNDYYSQQGSHNYKSELSIYKNHLIFYNRNNDVIVEFKLFSMDGKLSMKTNDTNKHIFLPLNEFGQGIYYARLITNKEKYILKFLIR